MMRCSRGPRGFTIALAAMAATAGAAAAAERPLVPLHDAAGVQRACDEGRARVLRSLRAMQARRGAGAIFAEWNHLSIEIEDVINPVYLLSSVHPDKAVRDAAEPCLQEFTTLSTEIFQSEKLLERVRAASPSNPHQAKLAKDLIEGFEDSGATLPRGKRERAKEIFDRLEALRPDFDRNIRDDPTKLVFTPKEMEGLPESYLRARTRNAGGDYVLGLDHPTYFPFMERAKDEAARKRYFIAKLNEGGAGNLAILEEIFRLRKELAGLYGLPTFAHYALRRKMAQTPEAVATFLGEVKASIAALEKSELDELRAEKARELGQAVAATEIGRWDVLYYQVRVRKARFSIDQEQLRKYFRTDKAIEYVLLLSQRLYGVRFKEVKVPVWHPDVRYFDVLDARSGRFVAGFYLDLFPREGKYGHAAAFPIRGASVLAGRTPLSALVANLNREGLSQEELETLLHEFGHVLHAVLSRTDYNPHAGTSVKGDFVEAPSQMFEEWARRERPLALFKEVCPDCPQLGRDDIVRLEASRRYGRGIFYASQWLYATFDMALSTDPQPPLTVWKSLESATPLGFVEGTSFPSGFSHIASHYAAGYYGYMWSQVLALDMLSAFKADMLDPKVGARYRDTILAQGGQEEEMTLVRRFLGRAPSNAAFFAEITGKR